jgi:hypothetical protein
VDPPARAVDVATTLHVAHTTPADSAEVFGFGSRKHFSPRETDTQTWKPSRAVIPQPV